MTKCDFVKNVIEVRPLKWWEKILHFRYIRKRRTIKRGSFVYHFEPIKDTLGA